MSDLPDVEVLAAVPVRVPGYIVSQGPPTIREWLRHLVAANAQELPRDEYDRLISLVARKASGVEVSVEGEQSGGEDPAGYVTPPPRPADLATVVDAVESGRAEVQDPRQYPLVVMCGTDGVAEVQATISHRRAAEWLRTVAETLDPSPPV